MCTVGAGKKRQLLLADSILKEATAGGCRQESDSKITVRQQPPGSYFGSQQARVQALSKVFVSTRARALKNNEIIYTQMLVKLGGRSQAVKDPREFTVRLQAQYV